MVLFWHHSSLPRRLPVGSSQKISLTVLGLFSFLLVVICVGWALTQSGGTPSLEALSVVDEQSPHSPHSPQSPFNTGIIPPIIPNDAGAELYESHLENLRELHAQDLQDILAQIEQNSLHIGSLTLDLYDFNRNGRITCAEAREAGIAPVTNRRPAYRFMSDANEDGVVCES